MIFIDYDRSPEYIKAVKRHGAYHAAEMVSKPVTWRWNKGNGEYQTIETEGDERVFLYYLKSCDPEYKVCFDASEALALIRGMYGIILRPDNWVSVSHFQRAMGYPVSDRSDLMEAFDDIRKIPRWQELRWLWEAHERINIRGVYVLRARVPRGSVLASWVCDDDRVRGGYLMLGARKTGRATSSPLYALRRHGPERASLIPSYENGALIRGDWSSLEPMVMAYLLDIDWKLNTVPDGKDLYEEVYRKLKGLPDDYEVSPGERKLAKLVDIACGYGGGAGAISAGHRMPIEDAKELLHRWRATHPQVVETVRALDKLIRSRDEQTIRIKPVELAYNPDCGEGGPGGELVVYLPSGHVLRYQQIISRWGDVTAVTPDESKHSSLTGAILLQNIVCAFSADLLYHALWRLDHLKCVVMHQYDEIVLDAGLSGKPKRWLADKLENAMTNPAPWATGLKLNVKIQMLGRYE